MAMNMSYCRFKNTLEALRECYNALAESDSDTPLDDLSEQEKKAAKQMLRLCRQMADDYGDEE